MRGIDGQVAIVTGDGSGIGQAIAIRPAQAGANVAINYVGDPDGAESTRDAIERGRATHELPIQKSEQVLAVNLDFRTTWSSE